MLETGPLAPSCNVGDAGLGDLFRAEVAAERFRDADAAVGLLVGLEERDVEPREGCARAVERVTEAVFAVFILVAQVHAPRLIVAEIAAAGNLEIGVLSRSPDFDVIG